MLGISEVSRRAARRRLKLAPSSLALPKDTPFIEQLEKVHAARSFRSGWPLRARIVPFGGNGAVRTDIDHPAGAQIGIGPITEKTQLGAFERGAAHVGAHPIWYICRSTVAEIGAIKAWRDTGSIHTATPRSGGAGEIGIFQIAICQVETIQRGIGQLCAQVRLGARHTVHALAGWLFRSPPGRARCASSHKDLLTSTATSPSVLARSHQSVEWRPLCVSANIPRRRDAP